MTDKKIVLRFDDETNRRLEKIAAAEERDVAQQVRFWVRRGIEAWQSAREAPE